MAARTPLRNVTAFGNWCGGRMRSLAIRSLVGVVLLAGLAGCDRTDGTTSAGAEGASTPDPQPTVQHTGAFGCPTVDAMKAAVGVAFVAGKGSRNDTTCQYAEADGGGGRSVVVLHPPYSTGAKQQTLADYQRDGQAANGRVTKRPEYGPDAFEWFTSAQICAIWMPAVDGLPLMVQLNALSGAPFDACAGARAAAKLFLA
jgi:hypothetical protein